MADIHYTQSSDSIMKHGLIALLWVFKIYIIADVGKAKHGQSHRVYGFKNYQGVGLVHVTNFLYLYCSGSADVGATQLLWNL